MKSKLGLLTTRSELSELNEPLTRRYFEAHKTGNEEALVNFIGSECMLHPGGVAALDRSIDCIVRIHDHDIFNVQVLVKRVQ